MQPDLAVQPNQSGCIMTTIEHVLEHVQANLDDCIIQTANQIRHVQYDLTQLEADMQAYQDAYKQLGKLKSQSVQQTVFYEVRVLTSKSARILHYLDYKAAKREYDQCLDSMGVKACIIGNTVEHTNTSINRLMHMDSTTDGSRFVGLFELRFKQPDQPDQSKPDQPDH